MSAEDVVLVGAIVFTLAIAFFVSYFAVNIVYTSLLGTAALNATPEVVAVFQAGQKSTGQMDYVVFAVFIGLTIAIIVSGWFIGGNTLFMILYFLVWVIAVILSAIFSNTWQTITQMAVFGTTISAFPLSNNLLSNFPIYLTIVGFIGIIAMFAKPYFAQQSGGGSEY